MAPFACVKEGGIRLRPTIPLDQQSLQVTQQRSTDPLKRPRHYTIEETPPQYR